MEELASILKLSPKDFVIACLFKNLLYENNYVTMHYDDHTVCSS